jgi:CheY-like chemotaxis protein
MSGPPASINRIRQLSGTPPPDAAAACRRVFIVDDNVDGAASLAMLLELEGHTVSTANSPADALQRIESFQPDVVLLDIGLPDMDGYELLRRLRMLPALAAVRFIATTGYGESTDRERARQAGFDEHLLKPWSFEVLAKLLAVGNARAAAAPVTRRH